MKKYINTLLIGLLASMFMLSACSDYLEAPLNGGVSAENFYQTDEDAEMAVTVVYDILTWHENSWGWASPILAKTLPSDEGQCGGGGDTDQPPYQQLDDYNFDATNQVVLASWNVNYFGIYRANLAIENIEVTNDLRKRLVAEAKALRAFYYMELVSLWGDVPLILTELPVAEYNQERTSKEVIYTQIEKDLTEAIADLPLKSEYSQADVFRMSKGTAQALLGKTYLFQKKYGEAVTQFENVINSGEYSLEPNFSDIFKESAEFGVESLMEASYTNTQGYDWGNYPWNSRHEDNVHIQLMGIRDRSVPALGILAGWGFNIPSQKLFDAYEAAGDEVRKDATILTEADYQSLTGNNSAINLWDYEGFFRTKYATFEDETSSNGTDALNYGTNWRLLRYADILLLTAEAYYFNGNTAGALVELNKVRARVGLDAISASGDAVFEAIVNERFLELAFEGQRFIDLVRWELADRELGSLNYEEKHALWPIPQSELAAATKLTQNPGW